MLVRCPIKVFLFKLNNEENIMPKKKKAPIKKTYATTQMELWENILLELKKITKELKKRGN